MSPIKIGVGHGTFLFGGPSGPPPATGNITGRLYRRDGLSSTKRASGVVLLASGRLSPADLGNVRVWVGGTEVIPSVKALGHVANATHSNGTLMGVRVQFDYTGVGDTEFLVSTDTPRTIGTGVDLEPTFDSSGLPEVYLMMDDPDQIIGSGLFLPTVSRANTPSSLDRIDTCWDAWEPMRRLGTLPLSNKWDRGLAYYYAYMRLPKGHAMQRTWFEHAAACAEAMRISLAPGYGGNEWNNWCESWAFLYAFTGRAVMGSAIGSVATSFATTKTYQMSGGTLGVLYEESGGRGWNHGMLYSLWAWRLRCQGPYSGKPTFTPTQHRAHVLHMIDLVLRHQLISGTSPTGPKYPGPYTSPVARGQWFTGPTGYPNKVNWYMSAMVCDALWAADQWLTDAEIGAVGESGGTTPTLYPSGRADRRTALRDAIVACAETIWPAWDSTANMLDYEFFVTNASWVRSSSKPAPYGATPTVFAELSVLGMAHKITGDALWRTRGDTAWQGMYIRADTPHGPPKFFIYYGTTGNGWYTSDEQAFNEVFSQPPKYLGLRT